MRGPYPCDTPTDASSASLCLLLVLFLCLWWWRSPSVNNNLSLCAASEHHECVLEPKVLCCVPCLLLPLFLFVSPFQEPCDHGPLVDVGVASLPQLRMTPLVLCLSRRSMKASVASGGMCSPHSRDMTQSNFLAMVSNKGSVTSIHLT